MTQTCALHPRRMGTLNWGVQGHAHCQLGRFGLFTATVVPFPLLSRVGAYMGAEHWRYKADWAVRTNFSADSNLQANVLKCETNPVLPPYCHQSGLN